jgi:phage-related protein
MDIVELASGSECELYALTVQGKSQVEDYISSLQDRDKKKVVALLHHICQKGPPTNEEKFRSLGDDIWELKTSSGIRILGFFLNPLLRKRLVLTHGFPKPHKKVLQREKKKAMNWRKEFFERKEKQGKRA